MSADPRAALNQLVAAFERHLEASSTRHGEDDPSVVAAYEDLADAFEAYDGALYDAYGEMTPLDIYTGDDGPDDEDDDDEDEDADDAGSPRAQSSDPAPLDADVLDAHDDEDGDGAQLYAGLDDDLDFDDDEEGDADDAGSPRAQSSDPAPLDADVLDAHDDEDGDGAQLYAGLDDDLDFDDDEESDDEPGTAGTPGAVKR